MDTIITFVCIFGIICAFLTIFLNINLIIQIVLKKSKRVEEMTLFYYRFVLDVVYGFILLLYVIFVLLSMIYNDYMITYRPLIVYLALPWSNLGACRSIIALSISMERVLAAYFPLKYRSYRVHFPNWIILSVGVIFGLSEWPVLFGFCSYQMEIPPSCRVLGCSVNKCFYNYWTGHKTAIFSSIVLLSVVLSIKLIIWNKQNIAQQKNQNLSRANRLALLDTVTVILFDFSPSFCGNIWPTFPLFSFDHVGPYNPVCKVVGCAIEAVLVTTVLLPKPFRGLVSEGRSSKKVSKVRPSEARLSVMA